MGFKSAAPAVEQQCDGARSTQSNPKDFSNGDGRAEQAALMSSTNTGLIVMMMLAWTGLVAASPLKNRSWLTVTPVNPQSQRRPKSSRSTRSQRNAYNNQNNGVAPATRSAMNPEGPIFSGISPFATK